MIAHVNLMWWAHNALLGSCTPGSELGYKVGNSSSASTDNGGVYRFARHPMYLAFFLQGKLNKKKKSK
jgi:protein-S-isoprenylcysteine O-methyltransferase Ste14